MKNQSSQQMMLAKRKILVLFCLEGMLEELSSSLERCGMAITESDR
jgi:hypothetical protein